MKATELKKFLEEKRLNLLEQINELKSKALSTCETFTERDSVELYATEQQLNLIKSIIKFYQNKKD